MRIGIIGYGDLNDLEKVNSSSKQIISDSAGFLSEYEIYLVPALNSTSEFFAQEYLKKGGEKLFSVIPLDDKEFGINHVNSNLGEKINCGTWRNQPEKLNEETDALVCFGYSTGALIEIAYSKWFNKKIVYIIKELVSSVFPKDAFRGLDIKYISYKDLGKLFI